MEKIQAALAKARATRDAQASRSGPGAETAPPPDLPPMQAPPMAAGPMQPGPMQAGSAQAAPVQAPPAAAPAGPAPAPVTSRAAAPAPVDESAPDNAELERSWQALTPFEPRTKVLSRNRIVALTGGSGRTEFDGLRTRVLQQIARNGWRRIAITSPQPACGKTTVAANLAFSLARHADHRIILMELDFRRPSLGRFLGLKGRHDIGRVLEGTAEFESHAVRYRSQLAIATATSGQRSPAELLQSAQAATALQQIEARYRPSVMLFDLPPMLASDDAMAFVDQIDAVLLIAAAESTTIDQIDRCERDIAAHTAVMGVVLNKCRYMEEPDYGY